MISFLWQPMLMPMFFVSVFGVWDCVWLLLLLLLLYIYWFSFVDNTTSQCYFVSAIVLLYWGGLPDADSVISLRHLISWGSVLVLCQVVPAHQSLPRRSLCGWSVCQNSWVTPATSSSPPSSSSTCSLDHPSTWPPSSGLRWELTWGVGEGG